MAIRSTPPHSPGYRRWLPLFMVVLGTLSTLLLTALSGHASEADLEIPDLHGDRGQPHFTIFGSRSRPGTCCSTASFVIAGTLGISLYLRAQIKKLPAHKSMLDIAEIIFQTCKTYLIQQGKFLLMLFAHHRQRR